MSPYLFDDYKEYLHALVHEKKQRGMKASLAQAAGCQRSFLSQVLNGNVHLTLDHAIGMAEYLRLSSDETEYFYALVGLARSASFNLKNFYKGKLEHLKSQASNLTKRFEEPSLIEVTPEYYSNWKYAAIHILCTIPMFQEAKSIAKKISLDIDEVNQCLLSLEKMGLVKRKKNKFVATQNKIHIPKTHYMTETNHRSWRSRNVTESLKQPQKNISYTAAYSMSRKDFERLKEMTIEFLNSSRELVIQSEEEELVGFTLDCVCY